MSDNEETRCPYCGVRTDMTQWNAHMRAEGVAAERGRIAPHISRLLNHLAEHPSNWPHGSYGEIISAIERWENEGGST